MARPPTDRARLKPGPGPDDGAPRDWLPDFCTTPAALSLAIVAELVLLVVLLAPDDAQSISIGQFATATLFVQWLAALCILALCRLRPRLAHRPVAGAVAATLAAVLVVVVAASLLAHWLGAAFGVAPPQAGSALGFAAANGAIAVVVCAAVLRYVYVQAEWQRGERARSRAELAELQARIRPHFLFNTLNAIATLVPRRPADAERAIEDLAELLRTALGTSEGLTSLDTELQLVERYLDIERLRLGDRLATRLDVPPDLRTRQVPSLCLQPLVENAIIHGIERRADGGEVAIVAALEADGSLCLTVTNPTADATMAGRERRGLGSAQDNVRRRIAHHFGNAARLEARQEAGYYSAMLRIPPG